MNTDQIAKANAELRNKSALKAVTSSRKFITLKP